MKNGAINSYASNVTAKYYEYDEDGHMEIVREEGHARGLINMKNFVVDSMSDGIMTEPSIRQ